MTNLEKIKILNKAGITKDYNLYTIKDKGNEWKIYKIIEADTTGCILVGNEFRDINNDGLVDVTNSKLTMKKLLNELPLEFELEII